MLKEWQIQLASEILASRVQAKNIPWEYGGYPIGRLVDTDEEMYTVRFIPGYGIVSHALAACNGDLGLVLSAVSEGCQYLPALDLSSADVEEARTSVEERKQVLEMMGETKFTFV